MVKKIIEDAINAQIKNELYSAYFYLSMSAYCTSINMRGSAHWLRLQYNEELSHAMRLFDFLTNRGGRVALQAIDQPPQNYKSLLDVFEKVLAHEQKVTAMINELYELAVKENDYPTQIEMQWFINEQVEEESTASEIIEKLKMVGDQGPALLMIDAHLGKRGSES